MARYNVKMSCGHEQEVNLTGKKTFVEMKIAYLKRVGKCMKCGPFSRKNVYRPKSFKPYKED